MGAEDGEFLEKEFMPEFLQTDLVNLAKANIYIKLMIDGIASRPFSAETIPAAAYALEFLSRRDHQEFAQKYGTPRAVVESRIAGEWLAKSDSAIDEKIGRRDEKRLSEVLRPGGGSGARPQSGARYPGQSAAGFSGSESQRNSSSFSNGQGSPRRVQDVEHQREGDRPAQPSIDRAPRENSSTTARPSVGGSPLGSTAEPQKETSSKSATPMQQALGVQPRKEEVARKDDASQVRIVMPQQRIAEEKRPAGPTSESTASNSGTNGNSFAPRSPLAQRPRSESEPKSANEGIADSSDTVDDPLAKKSSKPNVDIEALRRAINESLQRQQKGNGPTASEKNSVGELQSQPAKPFSGTGVSHSVESMPAVREVSRHSVLAPASEQKTEMKPRQESSDIKESVTKSSQPVDDRDRLANTIKREAELQSPSPKREIEGSVGPSAAERRDGPNVLHLSDLNKPPRIRQENVHSKRPPEKYLSEVIPPRSNEARNGNRENGKEVVSATTKERQEPVSRPRSDEVAPRSREEGFVVLGNARGTTAPAQKLSDEDRHAVVNVSQPIAEKQAVMPEKEMAMRQSTTAEKEEIKKADPVQPAFIEGNVGNRMSSRLRSMPLKSAKKKPGADIITSA